MNIDWTFGIQTALRRAIAIGIAIFVLAIVIVTLSVRSEQRRVDRNVAVATGKALDKVATETPKIREDQQEKQREVDEIQGSDQRLPDGYGADLERVRRGHHPR